MGFALADEAQRRGATVTLVAGPTGLEPPAVAATVRVRSAAEMHSAVMTAAPGADVVIMAAAVADYTTSTRSGSKITKSDGPMTLVLERTADILADLSRMPSRTASGSPVLVGFAAETGDAVAKARAKRARKNVDLIVANDVSVPGAGFDVSTNEVTIVGETLEQHVALASKERVAEAILDQVETILTRARSVVPAS
jgi:phosphopantothenoylcysteine decarboxylase/phosphopantothenate--cysteine ligase